MSANFRTYVNEMQSHIDDMVKDGFLYSLDIEPDYVWEKYLDNYPSGSNDIFRKRREFDCSCCRSFVKKFGNVVSLKGGKYTTIWDFEAEEPFNSVNKLMSDMLKGLMIKDIYVPDKRQTLVGTVYTVELLEDSSTRRWNHFNYNTDKYLIKFNDKFRVMPSELKSEVTGRIRDDKAVFKRSLDEISMDALQTVLELIAAGSIYRGDEWKNNLQVFKTIKKDYDSLTSEYDKDLFAWEQAANVSPAVVRIKNHSMGKLLTDITDGIDLDRAVKAWEDMVAGPNYKRPKPLFTKKMLEDAKNKLAEMNYLDSLKRRYAVLDDISVNDILFCDRNAAKRIKGTGDIFDEMASSIPVNPKSFSKVEEVNIDTFVSSILPTAKSIELFLDNRLTKNLVSLIAPEIPGSKSMFKWNNPFSWAYTGNITDSNIKENVKNAGGNVTGDLRFSIQWNDENQWDQDDLDAHCIERYSGRKKYEIYYGNRSNSSPNGGRLDVDIIHPTKGVAAVENIFYSTKDTIKDGTTFQFFVHQFTNRGGKTGFKAEIEFNGQLYQFEYRGNIPDGENIQVAEVTYKNGEFSIKEKLPSTMSSKDLWGLTSMQFHPVTVIMNSPNFWEGSSMTGNKHWFFMLDGMVNEENPNGFYNEFLVPELDKYRHVTEALGEKLSVVSADDQLSGVGFSSTIRNNVILKVTTNNTTRTLKVTF